MKLFWRLFLSYALVIVLTVVALLLLTEVFASSFIRHHVAQMVQVMGPDGRSLQGDLTQGMRTTLTGALLIAAPLALLVAFLAASVASGRVVRAVRQLSEGSRAVASGEYRSRLPEQGQDELTDLARNFNRMAASLAAVEASRTELISTVAHELRTPMTALRGYAEGLNDGVLPQETAARGVLRETQAMERLVRDLSLVSRVEAGAVDLFLQDVDVQALLLAAEERFAPLAVSRDVRLDFRLAPKSCVYTDPERAAQILANLLGNALKYTPAGGQVHVWAEFRAPHVCIHVQDSGPGLTAEDQGRIFERFYRVDPSRSRMAGGSGVGLTVARGLARVMGGDVTVRAELGEGSTFSFTLPHSPVSSGEVAL
ncbi:HAMP domain-containing histidine kinase [Deinococcus sp. Arct2-2]|uniref:sensor histidine kinase n=1 Tax=Deinococcus sp. Arct2-2 TaxID=2568653 RepID=UPI0010A31B5A|nr:HAMP domain-containing sensor histidine kinase [Deinococcus sp. Arct2-2]THF69216.1 HAMP domain-containing histidine kinase [Deinococcus sp. Arct2-2]